MHPSTRRDHPTEPLPLGGGTPLPPWLFDESGGIQVSGDSGSGKSTFLCAVMVLLARLGYGFTCFDPHGDLVRKVKRLCLNMGQSVVSRLYEIAPGDTSVVTKFNPLAVERAGLDEFTWRARLTEKCGHAARILLHAWGETDFNSKPLLYKWVNRVLTAAALLGLPFAAVRHFLEVGSPVYQSLTRALPDFLTRLEFAELAGLRPRDREELIASTKNRVLGFLSNPVVEAALCSAEGALDTRTLLQDNAIILCDLSHQNVLREEDQEIFSNLWLSEVLHAVFGTPEGQRVPHWIILDELPVFASCAPLITAALRQVRKFLTRFVCAHQGVNFFEQQAGDRLLHALVGQCGIHFYFRHIDPLDAKFFGEIVALPGFSPTKVKHVLKEKQQYQAGHRLVILTDHSRGDTAGEEAGGSESEGTTQTDNWSSDTSNTTTRTDGQNDSATTTEGTSTDEELRRTVTEARATARGTSSSTATASGQREGRGGASAQSRTTGTTWSRSHSRTRSRTWKQTLVPVLQWREVVTSVTFLTPEEQTQGAAATLSRLGTGEALFYIAGHGVRKVRIPLLRDPFALTPRFGAKKLTAFRQELLQRPAYERPAVILQEQESFVQAWVQQLNALFASDVRSQPKGASPATGGLAVASQGGCHPAENHTSNAGESGTASVPPSPLTI